MTFAEYLVSRSGLPSGTLMEHLAAFSGGAGETVFAHRYTVTIQEPSITVTQRTKRQVEHAPAPQRVIRQPDTKAPPKHIAVFTATEQIGIFTRDDEMTVFSGTQTVTVHDRLDNETITIRRKG